MAVAFHCAVCNVPLDDALILMCNHNLCLPCAGKGLKAQKYNPASGDSVALRCTLCHAVTNVDSDSARHLVENVGDSGPGPAPTESWSAPPQQQPSAPSGNDKNGLMGKNSLIFCRSYV